MSESIDKRAGWSRRHLLASTVAATAAASAQESAAAGVPRIRLGKYSISRVICGANPFNAGSHLSTFFNSELKQFYTPDRIVRTLRRCEEVGINCWQSGSGNLDLHRRVLAEGGKMHFLSLEGKTDALKDLAAAGCIGVAHHGEYTDRMFKQGDISPIRDFLMRVRDAGLLAGISTHMPAVVDTVESKGWEVDYFMTCVYERHRTAEELKRYLGHVPIPVGEVYLEDDPARMYSMVRQTKKPCLAFKILAAGRLSERPQWVDGAFREAFSSIKASDAVIVGMYDRFSDQPAENAAFARRYGA
jgi:hypothetical protein